MIQDFLNPEQKIPFEENMVYSQREPDEVPTKFVGLQPLVRPLVTPMSNEQMSRNMWRSYLMRDYVPQRSLPSLAKTSALQQYLEKVSKMA
jgi:hypothetical protein